MCILASRDHTCIHPQVSQAKNKTEECRKSVENKEVGWLGILAVVLGIVYQDMMVGKLNRSNCVMFLFKFLLICARSRWLNSLYFRIIKRSSNSDS